MGRVKVVVGMSGGVDSSMAACLLAEQGYDVTGVTIKRWQGEDDAPFRDARQVADTIGIPHYVADVSDIFKTDVIDYFTGSYLEGSTPNPCIVCNRHIKWEALLKAGRDIGAKYVATGHYARVKKLNNGRWAVCRSKTDAKDQTYALSYLTQGQLEHTLMPLGEYTKDEVRAMAGERGLPVAEKADSQEICFIPDNDYAAFIEKSTGITSAPGNYVDKYGNILGQHKGIIHYTVGQRKRLGLSMGHPVFVTEVKRDTNEVVIGEAEDVFSDTLYCSGINYMALPDFDEEKEFIGKIRYKHEGSACHIRKVGEDLFECRFREPVRAVTPGQALVLYDGDYVAGAGMITGISAD